MHKYAEHPVQGLERAFPLRVLRYRLRRGSGAPATRRAATAERRVSRPWGRWGGEPGATGENWLLPDGDEARAEPLANKCTIRLRSGDVFRMLTPGGGWGPTPM